MRRPRCTTLAVAAAITLLGTSSPLASARFLSSLNLVQQPRSLSLSTTDSNTSSTVTIGGGGGRFGHESIYLSPPLNKLLLIGGQLDSNTTSSSVVVVTNEILEFRVGSSLVWGNSRGDSTRSAIPDNPSSSSSSSNTSSIEPSAFMAGTVDQQQGLIWLFGGIQGGGGGGGGDCSNDDDKVMSSFNFTQSGGGGGGGGGGTTFERLPPRRRQAQMLPILNLTTLSTDLWVFGGIADEYSCSTGGGGQVVGYMGIDRYSPQLGQVESMPWTLPRGGGGGELPVSDYSAQVLEDGTSVVFVGGQTSLGELVKMDQILVYNVELRESYLQTATGEIPEPRMGHISISLEGSRSILVHGGLSASNHTPLSDLYLLTPPPLSQLSQFSDQGGWTWNRLEISNDSMSSPALAYHGGSQIVGGQIVVSFGLDQSLEPSDEFWFLTIDEQSLTYTWQDTFGGNQAQVDSLLAASAAPSSQNGTVTKRSLSIQGLDDEEDEVKAMVKRVEVIANPKAYSLHDTSSSASSTTVTSPVVVQTGSGSSGSINDSNNNQPSSSSSSNDDNSPSSRPSSPSSRIVVSSPSSAASSSSSSSPSSLSSKSTTIGASIGGTLGALALVSIVVVLVRRRSARQFSTNSSMSPDMSNANSTFQRGGGGGGGAPLVSSLMYTRPVQRRMLSLGSTISELPLGDDGRGSENGTIRAINQGGGGGRDSSDPFSDDYNIVTEHGQLGRSPSTITTTTAGGGGGGSSLLNRTKSSVTSIPFLSTIARDSSSLSSSPSSPSRPVQDVYTSPAPTLSSRRSMRKPSVQLPSMPVPGTPAELIGLAVTSEDGHDGTTITGVPYRNESTLYKGQGQGTRGGGGEGWEPSFLKNQTPRLPPPPPLGSASTTDTGGGGIPAILRPATPLRVRNADPFADQ